MISPALLVKTWLLTPSVAGVDIINPLLPLLNNLFVAGAGFPNNDPNRVYVGHLPQGFDATFGPGVVIRVGTGTTAGTGGGAAHPELPLTMPRVQITTFAGRQEYDISDNVYFAIHDWIHRRNNIDLGDAGFVLSSLEHVEGQQVEDPHTFYATNISIWGMTMREE
jgi:hypothetical protein